MLVEPADTVVLLPATTRYEVPGGVTETSTERRIIFSPEVEGPRVEDARPEMGASASWRARVRPELADELRFASHRGDAGGDRRAWCRSTTASSTCARRATRSSTAGRCCAPAGASRPPTAGPASPPSTPPPVPDDDGRLRLSTRRGKQFNSMVHERRDALTGALREAVLVAAADAERLGLRDGDAVALRSDHGSLRGTGADRRRQARQRAGALARGQHAARRRSRARAEAGIPDYNTWVELEPVTSASQSA